MKKPYLIAGLALALLTSCTKDQSQKKTTEETAVNPPADIKLATVDPGTTSGLTYNQSRGVWECNFGAMHLTISPIPTDPFSQFGRIALAGVSCDNCSTFTAASNGYFAGSVPVLYASETENIRMKIKVQYRLGGLYKLSKESR